MVTVFTHSFTFWTTEGVSTWCM